MSGTGFPLYAAALSVLLGTATVAAAPVADLYDRAQRAGVEVIVDGHLDGSGVIVSSKGLVLTAAHLVRGERLEIRSRHLGRHRVAVVAVDVGHDLALLRLPRRTAAYPHLPLAHRSPPPPADVYLYGSPLYRHGVLLRGTLARSSPTYEYQPQRGHYVRVTHVSGSSPVGTSGGPWLDPRGRIIGIQSGLVHDGTAPAGLAYMAPLTAVRRLLRTARTGPVSSLRAGFEELWEQGPALRALFPEGTEGILPVRIVPGGPADRAGLRPTDLIVAIEGEPVSLRDELLDRVRARQPYEPVILTILRPRVGPLRVPVNLDDLNRSVPSPVHVLALDAGKTTVRP